MTQRLSNLIRRYPLIIRIPYLIFRRFQARYTIGVAGILFNTSGQILLVEHVFHPNHPWGLPGGWLDRNEDPAVAIIRELEEELQLKASIKEIVHVENHFPNHIDVAFLCEASNEVGELSYELLEYKWVDPQNLPPLNPFHRKVIDIALSKFHRS